MSSNWEVTDFQVQTGTPDGTNDTLYANGKMQVLVIVKVKAIDPTTGDPYPLSQDELDSIKLLDLNGPTQELSNPWTYTDPENEFDHSLDKATSIKSSAYDLAESPKAGWAKKDYWVSTSKVEHKTIGAQVEQPDGSKIDTSGAGQFDSNVVLNGVKPRTISFYDLSLKQDSDTSNGSNYDQDNYYLTISGQQVRRLEGGTYFGGDEYLKGSFAFFNRPEDRTIFYMWKVGPKTTVDVGTQGTHTTIEINQEPNAGCFTRMMMWDTHDHVDGWYMNPPFYVYDQCGNRSDPFYTDYSSKNTLSISQQQYHD